MLNDSVKAMKKCEVPQNWFKNIFLKPEKRHCEHRVEESFRKVRRNKFSVCTADLDRDSLFVEKPWGFRKEGDDSQNYVNICWKVKCCNCGATRIVESVTNDIEKGLSYPTRRKD